MPSFADSAVIFILALILFGPKKLPQLARQLGKLMAEFRRASNEFRMQMEDELRIEEQKEHQAKVDALAGPPTAQPEPQQLTTGDESVVAAEPANEFSEAPVAEPTPIAESGSLRMMPPSTGLPVESSAYGTGNHDGFDYHDEPAHNGNDVSNEDNDVPEHTILSPTVGMSSEEPVEEARPAEVHHA